MQRTQTSSLSHTCSSKANVVELKIQYFLGLSKTFSAAAAVVSPKRGPEAKPNTRASSHAKQTATGYLPGCGRPPVTAYYGNPFCFPNYIYSQDALDIAWWSLQ